ncbi:hypothetical protein LCGC14_2235520 [marine sediment metagenome]|uniref:Uncharacterized protein n=1 Tax=marine sediment metagenome TaxID=412755 RepID=A0A0F9D6R1_9ZZZZ
MAKDEAAPSNADIVFETFLARNEVLPLVRTLLRAAFAAGILHEMENRLGAIDVPCSNPTKETADAT